MYQVSGEELTATADAIRTKSGTSEPIEWQPTKGFAEAILEGCQADLDLLVNGNIRSYAGTVDRVRQSCFRGCGQLEDVQLPECLYIRQLAFRGCAKLAELVLPKCVSIQQEAFYSCSVLTRLVLLSSTMCVLDNANAFTYTPIAQGAGSIEVPAALVDAYKADPVWGVYAAQIRAYEEVT